MSSIDNAFILWERLHQLRRSSARNVTCSNDPACISQKTEQKRSSRPSKSNLSPQGALSASDEA